MLPALVFALTFAFSFASVSDMFVTKYSYKDTNANECEELQSNPCDGGQEFLCTVISAANGGPFQVYSYEGDDSSDAVCAMPLRNSELTPIPVP